MDGTGDFEILINDGDVRDDDDEGVLAAAMVAARKVAIQVLNTGRIVSKDTEQAPWQESVSMGVETLQILSYLFREDTSSPIITITSMLLSASNLQMLDHSSVGFLLPFTLAAFLIAVVFIVMTGVSIAQTKNARKSQLLRALLTAVTTWLACPLMDAFVRPAFSRSPGPLAYFALIIAFPILAALSVLLKVVDITTSPFSTTFWAKCHCRHDIARSAFKIIVVLLFNACQTMTVPVVVALPMSICIAYACTMFSPYFHLLANQVSSISACVICWGFTARSMAMIVGIQADRSVLQLFLIVAPFVTSAAFYLIRIRRATIANTMPLLLRNAFEVQIRSHDMLAPVRLRSKANSIGGGTLISDAQSEALMDSVQSLFTQMTTTFPDSSFLQIFRAMFFMYYRANNFSTLQFLEQAHKQAGTVDVYHIIRNLRLDVQEAISQAPEALINGNFAQFNTMLLAAVDSDQQAALMQGRFWTLLQNANTRVNSLHDLGADSMKAVGTAARLYEKCIQLNPMSPSALYMYGSFQRDVLNDANESVSLIRAADAARKTQRAVVDVKDNNLAKSYAHSIFNEMNPVVIVSGQPQNLGHIVDCNSAALHAFGYMEKKIMIRKNIAALIPAPIGPVHNTIMRTNLHNGRHEFSDTTRFVFAQHANGYIFPVHLYVSLFSPVLEHISFVGIMQMIPSRSLHLAVCHCDTLVVTAISASFARVFETDLGTISKGKTSLALFLPSFANDVTKFMHPNGHALAASALLGLRADCNIETVRVHVTKLPVPGHCSVYLIRVHTSGTSREQFPSQTKQSGRKSLVSGQSRINLLLSQGSKSRRKSSKVSGTAIKLLADDTGLFTQPPPLMPVVSNTVTAMSSIAADIRARLTKNVDQDTLSRRIMQFERMFRLTTLMIIVLAIVTYTMTNSLLNSFASNASFIAVAGSRRLMSMQIGDGIMRLILMQGGVLPLADQTTTAAYINVAASSLSTVSLSVYRRRSAFNGPHLDLLGVASLPVRVPGNVTESMTLIDLSGLLVESARLVSNLNPVITSDYNVEFAMTNAMSIAIAGFDSSNAFLQMQSEATYEGTSLWASSLSVAAVAIMITMLWVIVRPAIRRIMSSRETVMLAFSMMSRIAVESLRWRCICRIALHADIAHNGIVNNSTLDRYINGCDTTRNPLLDAHDDDSSGNALPSTRATKGIRTVVIGMTVCIAYFVAAYFTGFYNIKDQLLYKSAECNWATYRQMALLNVTIALRAFAAGSALPPDARVSGDTVLSVIDGLERVHSGLMFGDPAMHTIGMNSLFNDQSDIMMVNGCTPPSWDACLLYDNKIMQAGAHSGMLELMARARTAVANLERVCAGGDSCSSLNAMKRSLAMEEVVVVNTLAGYLAPTMQLSVDRYVAAMTYTLQTQFQQIAIVLLVGFLVTMVILQIVIYRPQIALLDQRVKDTQAMLLMISSEVIAVDTAMNAFIASHQHALQL